MSMQSLVPWIALCSAVVAVAVIAWTGWYARRDWKRVRLTQDAAAALIDVHSRRIDAAIELSGQHAERCADGGDELATALAELRADARHLKWMVGRISGAREQLTRELWDLVLPTSRAASDDGSDGRGARDGG